MWFPYALLCESNSRNERHRWQLTRQLRPRLWFRSALRRHAVARRAPPIFFGFVNVGVFGHIRLLEFFTPSRPKIDERELVVGTEWGDAAIRRGGGFVACRVDQRVSFQVKHNSIYSCRWDELELTLSVNMDITVVGMPTCVLGQARKGCVQDVPGGYAVCRRSNLCSRELWFCNTILFHCMPKSSTFVS
jgi:hypothetical protein